MCARRRPCGPNYFNSSGPSLWLTRPSGPVYNTGADFPRPHRLIMPRPTHLSKLPLMLRSSVSHGLVYINTPGRTCLQELFIEYEQVTAWVARFFFQQGGGKLSYTINPHLH